MTTKIFAHRGVRKHFPENTMPAFKAADAMGLDGIELDVQRTSDGQLVICHDEPLQRLSGEDVWLKDLTYEALANLNIAHYRPESPPEKVPTLCEFLDWFVETDLIVNLELKNTIVSYEGMEKDVLDLVDHYGLRDRVIISSFSLESMILMKEMAPDIDVGFLYQRLLPCAAKTVMKHGLDAIHPIYFNQLWPWLTSHAHRKGLKVRLWTVDRPLFIWNAIWRHVDTIITDEPELALRLRDVHSPSS